jgi:hypothetical protein
VLTVVEGKVNIFCLFYSILFYLIKALTVINPAPASKINSLKDKDLISYFIHFILFEKDFLIKIDDCPESVIFSLSRLQDAVLRL